MVKKSEAPLRKRWSSHGCAASERNMSKRILVVEDRAGERAKFKRCDA
jgi:hypothetical protein